MALLRYELIGGKSDAQVENNGEEMSWVAVHKLELCSSSKRKVKAYWRKLVDALNNEKIELENLWEVHIHYKWTPAHPKKLFFRISGCLFGKLKKLLSFGDVGLYFYIYFFGLDPDRVKLSSGIEISLLEFGEGELMEKELKVDGNVAELWNKQSKYSPTVSASIYFEFGVKDLFINHGSHSNQLKPLCKKMLEQNIHTDFAIVASNGKSFKCHKGFLAVTSPVFKKMFENEFKGPPAACEPAFEGISEECIAALLEYIYTLEINEGVSSSSAVAVGLFQLAHEYEIFNLAEILEGLFLQRTNNWFDLEPTLDLFNFSTKLERNMDQLNAKLCSVLKSKGYDVMSPQAYKKLSVEDIQVATDICTAIAIRDLAANNEVINFRESQPNHLKPHCTKMLEQNIHSDFNIMVSTRKGFKCHKSFLAVISPVFNRMLENESNAYELTLEGESEECVAALLEYIYTLEINMAVSSSAVAVGLFKLAHKFEILNLSEILKGMFLQRADEWFDLDPTHELVRFSRKLEHSTDELNAKLCLVLESKGQDTMPAL